MTRNNNRCTSYQAFDTKDTVCTNNEHTIYCEDVLHILVNGIYDTAGDGDYDLI